MKIAIGCDHNALELKKVIIDLLKENPENENKEREKPSF